MMTLQDDHKRLQDNDLFKAFCKENKDAYLAHAFIMADKEEWSEWQFGYYLPKHDEIISFFMEAEVKQSPPSEIFKKDKQPLGTLDLGKVRDNLGVAVAEARKIADEKYPGELITKTIVLVQNLGDHQVWNVTFVTMAFNTLNIRLTTDKLVCIHDEKQSLMSLGKMEGKAS